MAIEDEIKDKLETKIFRKLTSGLGGCINTGTVYEIDDGAKVYVKSNQAPDSGLMFEGEMFSLESIEKTKTIRVPKPKFTMDFTNRDEGAVLCMEYIDKMVGLSKYQDKCGEELAQLHIDNINLEKVEKKLENWVGKEPERQYVDKFGFDAVTCCGKIPLVNEWVDDWIGFYARNRLDVQIRMVQSDYGNREIGEYWSALQLKIPKFFKQISEIPIKPSLLHGDLWGGNAGETEEGPIIFDPASFYGHHEFELSIAGMFGGFRHQFYTSYFRTIKKYPGFDDRQQLYQLFHYLNHWNHFGGRYAQQSLNLMKQLSK
ncbi:ketosamine-3-kinase [Tetranychus urticae]|uniref:ketosamine-3-kinase n=1 Tax=Tetranychus urticae TaxID=32264 RepID=UPI00077BF37D|nr:ketosamine-3-kinase [Tetranychus urticae]XP_025016161.1 ketosamine-3-kinase [Tetranychus urticae]